MEATSPSTQTHPPRPSGRVNQELINRVLVECRTLELLIVFYLSTFCLDGEIVFPQKDPRIVFLKSVIDHLNHWEAGARGEEDFWITGEKCKEKTTGRFTVTKLWPNSASELP